jgi:hypothetical protein
MLLRSFPYSRSIYYLDVDDFETWTTTPMSTLAGFMYCVGVLQAFARNAGRSITNLICLRGTNEHVQMLFGVDLLSANRQIIDFSVPARMTLRTVSTM